MKSFILPVAFVLAREAGNFKVAEADRIAAVR
jgi:hypothetical protein